MAVRITDEYINLIQHSCEIDKLADMKEKLKERVLDTDLDWRERMAIYSCVQLINDRIKQLNFSPPS